MKRIAMNNEMKGGTNFPGLGLQVLVNVFCRDLLMEVAVP